MFYTILYLPFICMFSYVLLSASVILFFTFIVKKYCIVCDCSVLTFMNAGRIYIRSQKVGPYNFHVSE